MSPGKDWSSNDGRPSAFAWPITEVEDAFFRKSLLGTCNRRCDGRQEALDERVLVSWSESAVRNPVSGKLKVVQSLQLPWFCHCLSKVFIVTLSKWRAIFETTWECDKKPIIRPNINSTCVASAVFLSSASPSKLPERIPLQPWRETLCLQHNWATPCISTSDTLLPSIPLVGSVRWGQVDLRR